MKHTLLDAIQHRPLLCDGAMGTQLQLAGLEQGGCGEEWNLTHPEKIVAIQRAYVAAGSDCLITNTFGGSRLMLGRHQLGDRAAEINRAAVEIARQAFGDRDGYVIGDIGPFGGFLEPYGDVPAADVREALGEQAQALAEAGADAIIVETQTSLEELGLGIQAARDAGAPCVIGSMAYDVTRDGSTFRTIMGVSPEQAAEFMAEQGADIVALNCGTGMDMARACQAITRYRAVTDLPTMAQPNAGQPRLVQSQVVYDESPQDMARGVAPLLAAGARIVGACCGSSPQHILALREAIDRYLHQRTGNALPDA